MKVVCRQTCQLRLEGDKVVEKGGKITFIEAGTVLDLNKCPAAFASLESKEYEVDFENATEQELLKAKWSVADAQEAIAELYDYDLVVDKGDTKKDVVKAILDVRYRTADV